METKILFATAVAAIAGTVSAATSTSAGSKKLDGEVFDGQASAPEYAKKEHEAFTKKLTTILGNIESADK